ncbi:hypothetical protein EV714DRAFT_233097 [Schizophyllum commune]
MGWLSDISLHREVGGPVPPPSRFLCVQAQELLRVFVYAAAWAFERHEYAFAGFRYIGDLFGFAPQAIYGGSHSFRLNLQAEWASYFYAIASRALEVGHQLDEGRRFGWHDVLLQGRTFTDPASAWTNNPGLDALEAWSRPTHPACSSPPTYASARKVFAHQSDVLLAWRVVLTGGMSRGVCRSLPILSHWGYEFAREVLVSSASLLRRFGQLCALYMMQRPIWRPLCDTCGHRNATNVTGQSLPFNHGRTRHGDIEP